MAGRLAMQLSSKIHSSRISRVTPCIKGCEIYLPTYVSFSSSFGESFQLQYCREFSGMTTLKVTRICRQRIVRKTKNFKVHSLHDPGNFSVIGAADSFDPSYLGALQSALSTSDALTSFSTSLYEALAGTVMYSIKKILSFTAPKSWMLTWAIAKNCTTANVTRFRNRHP